MQAVIRRYNTVATGFYNLYRKFGTNFPTMPYETYLFHITRVYFPKIAYQNNFEPEYTKTSYHGYLTVALIGFTLVAARQAVSEEESKQQ